MHLFQKHLIRHIRFTPIQLLLSRLVSKSVYKSPEQMSVINENGDTESLVRERTCVTKLPDGVFYNPVQQFNRDISIAAIERFARDHFQLWQQTGSTAKRNSGPRPYSGVLILEALAASGLRSMRMCRELSAVLPAGVLKGVVANDLDPNAVDLIRDNAKRNQVEHLVTASCEDAILLMVRHACTEQRFQVIDIDPYGSASRFIDPAMQAIDHGGLVCVTCTDSAVLCGNAQGTSWGKYGAVALHSSPATHEVALRILLHALQSAAGRHGKVIEPLLSLSIDFYVRVFVRVIESPVRVKHSAQNEAMMVECVDCKTFALQPLATITTGTSGDLKNQPGRWQGLESTIYPTSHKTANSGVCPHCQGALRIGGPLWSGPLHNKTFVRNLLSQLQSDHTGADVQPVEGNSIEKLPPFGTLPRMIGMLQVVLEELEDIPLYYLSAKLASQIHCPTPSFVQLRSPLMHAGYQVSLSHCDPSSLKTNAPAGVIWRIMRAWACFVSQKEQRSYPAATYLADEKSTVSRLMRTYEELNDLEINFEPHPSVQPASRAAGLQRFAPNPEKNWGPKPRPKKRACVSDASEKQTAISES